MFIIYQELMNKGMSKFLTSQAIKVFFMKMETKSENRENFISVGAN